MAISASELIMYGSTNMPEDDTSASGGAIATTVRVIFDDTSLPNSLSDTVTVESSSAGDSSQSVTVYGRDSAGVIQSEVLSLNGVTPVAGAITYDRLLKAVISATHAGTISIKKASGGTVIAALESGVLTIRRPFYNAASSPTQGKTLYEKIFLKNTNATLTLTSAQVSGSVASLGSITQFAMETTQNSPSGMANRLTAPANTGVLSNTAKYIPPSSGLAAGSGIGIWLVLSLSSGLAPQLGTYSLTTMGNST